MAKKLISEQDFITVKGISTYCMVSTSTVRRWIMEGKLKAFRLPGGHFRVTVENLKIFLIQNRMPLPDELLIT